jgi:hypothetical protein
MKLAVMRALAKLSLLSLIVTPSGPAAAAPDIRIAPQSLTFSQPAARQIYIEIDWMENAGHSHRPSQAVLDRMAEVFAAAGYEVTFELSDAIPHQDVLAVANKPSSSPAVQSLMGQYFGHAGDSRWYYSLWAHNYSYNGAFTTSSGIADLPGRVHLVTLGSFAGSVGSFGNQAGTLIHEFGHNLGQRHGGADDENWKPNYLSVMNYFYQLQGIGPGLLSLGLADSKAGIEDFGYSHGLLPQLNENALDERAGIGLGKAVDWDCDGAIEASVAKDIQGGSWCSASGGKSTLGDFDNWTSLAGSVNSFAAGEERAHPCIGREENDLFLAELAARGTPLEPAAEHAAGEPSPAAGAMSFTIVNDGTGDLEVSSFGLDLATSWIAWSPAAPFTVGPGRSQKVYLTIDWDGVPPGTTRRRLLVGSNDPDENPYPGGVDLTVRGVGNCSLSTGSSPLSGGSTSGDAVAPCGSAAVARAQPATGFAFLRWKEGNATASTSATYSFTLNSNRSLVAEFAWQDGGSALFADGFESGTIAAWH